MRSDEVKRYDNLNKAVWKGMRQIGSMHFDNEICGISSEWGWHRPDLGHVPSRAPSFPPCDSYKDA